jgi:hypothetical protein
MVKFYPVEDYQANMLLKRVLENPDKFDEVVIRLGLFCSIINILLVRLPGSERTKVSFFPNFLKLTWSLELRERWFCT